MEHYFSFHKLQEYYDMISSVVIFGLFIGVIYTLASLYYWTTKDLKGK